MIISAALYLGLFSHMTIGMSGLLRGASCVVGVVALLWPGRVFLSSAFNALRTRTPHMDLPIALGLSVGTVAGLVNVVRGTGEIYFDSLSVLIFLLLVGRWIQFRQQARATDAIEMLYRLTPQMTRKLVDGTSVEMLVDLVEVDDLLEIFQGDLFPVDAEIVSGKTRVDESILTGESKEVFREEGDLVAAGTMNISSPVTIRAKAIGRDTRLSQIVELVEKASLEKPQIVQWANRVGGYFVAVVVLLAIFTFVYWSFENIETGIDRTIALLIVACPCALALATPLAIAVSLGRAAKERIMIKGGDILQSLQRPGMIWLDKTGTLTEGNLKVVHWHGHRQWIDTVATIENRSPHPVAKALVGYANEFSKANEVIREPVLKGRGSEFSIDRCSQAVSGFEYFEGQGIRGCVGDDDVLIGNEKLVRCLGVSIREQHERLARRVSASGLSPCWVAVNGDVVAIVALGDAVRPDAAAAISELKERGWQVGILSGDHQHVVDRVAKRLGVPPEYARGGVEPEAKLSTIKASSKSETVVMVGDGVNDSAALAAASVGIAVKGGAEASLAAAPVYFATPGLKPVLNLLTIADSTALTMRTNLGVSLAYNLSFAVLAFCGFITPLVAAILMPISSLTVVALSLGAGRGSRKQVPNGGQGLQSFQRGKA
jgi:Cu2+-exporting ATPase